MRRNARMLLSVPAIIAATPQSDRAAIDAQGERLDRAFETGHFGAWYEIFADDLHDRTAEGKVYTKTALIRAGKRERASALPPISVDVRNDRIDVQGANATVHVRERTCYTLKTVSGKHYPFCYRLQSVEQWRKDGGEWKVWAMRDAPHTQFLVAGKPVTINELRLLVRR